jgi:RHS repeat-associated protein
VTVDAAKTCVATFTRVTYTLTIQKTGDGSDDSWVTSSPAGIDCGSSCSAAIGGGAVVQLTPSAADGFEFVGWQGTGCSTGTFTMTGARTCTAVFQAAPPTCDPDGCLQAECRASGGGRWDAESCSCHFEWEDPLVLTLDGKPIHLTDAAGGVEFDLGGSGTRTPVAWTRAGSTAAFLVLDLDQDGLITTGAELLGVPVGAPRRHKPAAGENSFTLLAAYDDPANGGNGDGKISAADAVFNRLRLWVDANHDGVSQPGELLPLAAAGVVSIELSYHTTGRRDGHGNFFRYRGVVHLSSGRTVPMWDVFLGTGMTARDSLALAQVPRPADDDSGFVGGGGEEDGSGASEEDAVAGTPGAPRQDPPPTPLQVVEYYHLDALGSVRAVTDAQGQVIARHDFLPFGDELNAQNPPHDRKLFTGQERDVETGLDYFHARQLRVDLGRFTAPDPLTDLAWTDGTLGATNAYSYVQNNPLGFIDPMGAAGQEPPPPRADPCSVASDIPCFKSGVTVYPELEASFREFVFTHVYIDPHPIPQIGPERGGGGGSNGNQTPPPNVKDCLLKALPGAGRAVLDAGLALVPEGGAAVESVKMVIGVAATNWTNSTDVGMTSVATGLGVAQVPEYIAAIRRASPTLSKIGKFIPVVSTVLGWGAVGIDAVELAIAFRDCIAGGQ